MIVDICSSNLKSKSHCDNLGVAGFYMSLVMPKYDGIFHVLLQFLTQGKLVLDIFCGWYNILELAVKFIFSEGLSCEFFDTVWQVFVNHLVFR